MRYLKCLMMLSCLMFFVFLDVTQAGEGGALIVAGFESGEMKDGAPVGWELVEKGGTPNLVLEKQGTHYALHLKSDRRSSFGIKKEINLKVGEYSFLNWDWRALRLPDGADVRNADTDDQAIQVYVGFEPTGWPAKLNTPVIGYIWDVECPKGSMVTSSQLFAGKVRHIVLRNKSDTLGQWYREKRNLAEDFRKLFPDIDGGKPRDINGIVVYIDSQDTESEAESSIYNIRFSKE